MMFDFYGMRIVDWSTGQVARATTNHKSRYSNLLRNSHNFLRITRILKSNSELGREYLNAPWLLFFLLEQARGELNKAHLVGSMDGYWRYAIRNHEEREVSFPPRVVLAQTFAANALLTTITTTRSGSWIRLIRCGKEPRGARRSMWRRSQGGRRRARSRRQSRQRWR